MTPLENHVAPRGRGRFGDESRFDGENRRPSGGRSRGSSSSRDSWSPPAEATNGWAVQTLAHDSSTRESAPNAEPSEPLEAVSPPQSNRARPSVDKVLANRADQEPRFARQTPETGPETNDNTRSNPFDEPAEPKASRKQVSNNRDAGKLAAERSERSRVRCAKTTHAMKLRGTRDHRSRSY